MSQSVTTTTRTFEYDDEGRTIREVTVVEDNFADPSSTVSDTRSLAVDADGYVWRINEDGSHSMARTNPDNSTTPLPLTYYVPVGTR